MEQPNLISTFIIAKWYTFSMKAYSSGKDALIVLKKGETLMGVLNQYAKDYQLNGGWVNVIGGAGNVTLGYYDAIQKEYVWQEFNEFLEIIGLQGNLAWVDGEPFWHIHGTFSRKDFTTIAGHVKDCEISLTGEVYLRQHDRKLTRLYDDETGLKLLTEPEEL